VKTSQRTVKSAEQTSKMAIKTSQASAKAAQKAAAASVKTARAAAQAAKATAKAVAVAVKTAAKAVAAAVKAIIAAVKELVAAIAAGGWVAVLIIVVVVLIVAVIASPFGIFFSSESSDSESVPASAAIAQINYDFNSRLEAMQNGSYDDIVLDGAPADWTDVLAVFAVKVAGAEDASATYVASLDAGRVEKLKSVFYDMTSISSYVEVISHPDSDPDDEIDDSWAESILHITVSGITADEAAANYHFSDKQKEVLAELLAEREMLRELIGDLHGELYAAKSILNALPDDLSPERREVIKTACSLVGKVNYFWGGKSRVIGWDSRWGTLQKVWADGSSTTGTYRPYGLDCSGFVDWVFYNATNGDYYPGQGGGAADQHANSSPTTWEAAQPGDLVFYPGDEHVGIVAGFDEDGEILIIHCASGYNNVVITGIEGFVTIATPPGLN
jgi:cell wall-associated NlpC family hydrolase